MMERPNSSHFGIKEDARPLLKQRPLSAVYPRSETSHLQQWSVDFSKLSTSAVVTVKKNKTEPVPPRRSVSLLRPQPAKLTTKRYSCPVFGMTAQNSSTAFSTPASSSPPLTKTSTITGPDPLGWKVRHKSSNSKSRSHAGRLSLQIPISDIFPETRSPETTSPASSACKVLKPVRRHNSDPMAFLRSTRINLPVTIDELCTVELRRAKGMSNSDDVFGENMETPQRYIKGPPPIPTKSEMARQVAQLIACSRELSIETPPKVEEHFDTKL